MGITRKEQNARGSLIDTSYVLMDRFLKISNGIVENRSDDEVKDIFINPEQLPLRNLLIRGLDYANGFALKAMPNKVEGGVQVGVGAFLDNIISKLGTNDESGKA